VKGIVNYELCRLKGEVLTANGSVPPTVAVYHLLSQCAT